ncbi:MAG TPA: trigger factor [Candidatus Eisenbacteria bacterium]|nr:trigger factor [Candidatus Eisenbacteria bacterium]
MKVEVRDSEAGASQKVLMIEVSPEELNEDYDAILEDYRRRAVLPGFRKGKAPRNVLELQFGHSMEHEVLERAVKRTYEAAVREHRIEPVSYPQIEKIRFDKGQPLSYEATVDVRPSITPRDYFELSVPTKEVTIPEDEVEKSLEELRQRTADWSPVEREAALGDAVVVDYVRLNAKGKPVHKSEQKDALVELDAQGLLPEFRENLLGKKGGEHIEFTVTYPEEFGNAELKGRTATFSLDVKGVRERRVRPLDDAFASEVIGMRDLAELRARMRLNLESEARLKASRDEEEAIVDQLLAKNPIALPESMVAEYLEGLLQRLKDEREWTPEEEDRFRTEYRPTAERRIKRDLLLDAIMRAESIGVSEEEIDTTLRGAMGDETTGPEAERAIRNPAQRERARNHLLERKLFQLLREKAQLKITA